MGNAHFWFTWLMWAGKIFGLWCLFLLVVACLIIAVNFGKGHDDGCGP